MKLEVSIASQLSEHIKIEDISCVGIEAKYLGLGTPNGTLSFKISEIPASWALEEEVASAIFEFGLDIFSLPGDGQESTPVAVIKVDMRIGYSLMDGFPMDKRKDIEHFLGICGFLHLWPYFRAEVQALTNKLGFPPLVLPVMLSGHASQYVKLIHVGPPPAHTDTPEV